jgi:glycosyltransferase involved in cell wall biosynthesis
MNALVTVIVPVYNGEKYLKEALDTIFAQTHPLVEVVVIDDGSTDGTAEIAANFGSKVHIIRKQNGGIGAARNIGVEAATGDYIAFLDADDLWTESKLLQQLQLFRKDPALDMVFGEVAQFFSPDMDPASLEKYRSLPPQMKCQFAGTMLIKRTSFEKVGLFSTTLQVGEYIDWYCRAQELKLKQGVLPELVLKRRIHGANTTLQRRDSRSDYLRILHESLQRRRIS